MKRIFLFVILGLLAIIVVILTITVYRAGLTDVPPSNILPTIDLRVHAIAQCNDGYYSYATHTKGQCSGHDGVRIIIGQ